MVIYKDEVHFGNTSLNVNTQKEFLFMETKWLQLHIHITLKYQFFI